MEKKMSKEELLKYYSKLLSVTKEVALDYLGSDLHISLEVLLSDMRHELAEYPQSEDKG